MDNNSFYINKSFPAYDDVLSMLDKNRRRAEVECNGVATTNTIVETIKTITREANSSIVLNYEHPLPFYALSTFISGATQRRYLFKSSSFDIFFSEQYPELEARRTHYVKHSKDFFLISTVAIPEYSLDGKEYIRVIFMHPKAQYSEFDEYSDINYGYISDDIHAILIPKEDFFTYFLVKECATDSVMNRLNELQEQFAHTWNGSSDVRWKSPPNWERIMRESSEMRNFLQEKSAFCADTLLGVLEKIGRVGSTVGFIVPMWNRHGSQHFLGVTREDRNGNIVLDCGEGAIVKIMGSGEDSEENDNIVLPDGVMVGDGKITGNVKEFYFF